ncbi:hypothetical protein ACH5RR_005217 [Cinchona calisaya]|uniref:Sodium/calcium exchanger membrane region domain-containing protein n=1 Tax=Cinchona calisaya TaxID=153742 RepID=A0ABD3AKR8_9GENT
MACNAEALLLENGNLKSLSKETRHGRTAHNMSSSSLRKKSDIALFSKVPYGFVRKFLANLQEIFLGTKLSVLFLAIPFAIIAECHNFGRPWVFVLSLLGLTPLAERVSFLTEQLALYTGPAVGGLLNATCGNATELIIAMLALFKHKVDVVKYSLLGSVLSNLLLVLGTSLFCGGLANLNKEQKYDRKQADVNSMLLFLGLLCQLLPLMFRYAGQSDVLITAKATLDLSRVCCILMLIAYFAYLIFQLWTHRQFFEAPEDENKDGDVVADETPVLGFSSAFAWLAAMTAVIALLSEYVVGTIEAASDSWGLSVSFISLILLPIVGNAAEHAGAIIFAFKNKLDISLGVALGSATQISMFVVPLSVIVAWILGINMDLNFNLLETGSLALSIIITAFTLQLGPLLQLPAAMEEENLCEMRKTQVSFTSREIPALKSSNASATIISIGEPEILPLTNRFRLTGSTRSRDDVCNFECVSMAEKKLERDFFPTMDQLLNRPLAVLALVPNDAALFAAGAIAGAAAKTVTAPLDRIKLLMQTHGARAGQEGVKKGIEFVEAITLIGKEEGIKGYWKGNFPQVIRIIPYTAVQLFAYETYKKLFSGKDGKLSVIGRLAAGACAGMTSTFITYPLDVLRLRLAVEPGYKTMTQVALNMLKEEGVASFYNGLGPSLIGIAPYIAVNFCVFDLVKKAIPEEVQKRTETSLLTGLISATVATVMCYPLDTIRRQMQMRGTPYKTVLDAFPGILERDGLVGLYRGFVPNALKTLPSSSIKLTTFDTVKRLIIASEKELQEIIQENSKNETQSSSDSTI